MSRTDTFDEIRRMHALGMMDSQIAAALDESVHRITRWRNEMGLSNQFAINGERYDAQIRELHAAGHDDPAIGSIIGIHKSAVGRRRNALGLKSINYRELKADRGHSGASVESIEETAAVYRMFCDGLSDRAVVAEMGLTLEAVAEHRRRMPKWWAKCYGHVGRGN